MTNDMITPLDENTRRYYLDVMGIQCWESIDHDVHADNLETSAVVQDTADNLKQIETDVQQCTRCQLHNSRRQAIAGRGNVSAELMIVLLAPYSNDDVAGQLCSGEANELFTKMLAAINIAIDDVYITSLLKCSVPARHTITTTELHHCKAYLIRQIQLVRPKLLVVLGDTTARCILQRNRALDELREEINAAVSPGLPAEAAANVTQFESVPLFVSYSPDELIRQPENKRKAWHDLQQLQKIIEI